MLGLRKHTYIFIHTTDVFFFLMLIWVLPEANYIYNSDDVDDDESDLKHVEVE
jgi:hypothetical protein